MIITIRVPDDTMRLYFTRGDEPFNTHEMSLQNILNIKQEDAAYGKPDALEEA